VFAVVEDEAHAKHLARLVRQQFAPGVGQVWITSGCNHGALNER
jgi:hypothetical protein